jgi:selenocysteine lyase/cysteine desulfurase
MNNATSSDPALEASLLRLLGGDQKVPTVQGEIVRYVNLDMAATTPALEAVWETVEAVAPWYGSANRGSGYLAEVSTEVLESARRAAATFVGAPPGFSTVFTRNTTDAINLLAAVLPSGATVVAFASEHHANLLPWLRRRATILPVPGSADELLASAEQALVAAGTGARLLAVTGASNVTGEVWPLAELAALAHRQAARLFVDAAQLAPHRVIDMNAIGADYLAWSGHKMYAPFGAGALVGRSDWLDQADPYLRGGGAVRRVTLDGATWREGPERHEAGSPNLIGVAALAASCHQLSATGMDVVRSHEVVLHQRLLAALARMPAVTRYTLWPGATDRVAVTTFNLEGYEPACLAAILGAEHGIGVRYGSFCAHPLVDHLTMSEGGPGAVRASFGVGTCADDVDRLVEALHDILAHGPRWSYKQMDGRFAPDPDPRPRPKFASLDLMADGSTPQCF